jgi:hypothetical protein
MSKPQQYYQVGGTLQPEDPSYKVVNGEFKKVDEN